MVVGRYSSTPYLTSTQDVGKWSVSHSGLLTLYKVSGYVVAFAPEPLTILGGVKFANPL
jgi:hypothetical protein